MTVKLIPKLVNLSCTLRVVHDHLMGWDRTTGNYLNDSIDMKCFPYGLPVAGLDPGEAGGSETINDSFQRSNRDTLTDKSSCNDDKTRGTAHGQMSRTDTQYWHGWDTTAPIFSAPELNSSNAEALYANTNGYLITLVHIPSGMKINFKAFLTSMNDNYTIRWDDENLFGRNDPVKIYQGTSRVVTLNWDLVAASVEEGVSNLQKCTMFSKALYPMYRERGSATSILSPPMMAVKFTNLVSQGQAGAADARGLTGTITGFNFSPNVDAGWFEYDDEEI